MAPGSGLGWPGPALGTRAFNNADEALAINYSSPPPPCRGQRAGRQRWAEDGAERVSEGPPCGEAAGLLLLGSCWGVRGRCQAPAILHGVPASRPPGQLSGVLVSPAGKAGVLVSGKNLLVSETTPAPCPPARGNLSWLIIHHSPPPLEQMFIKHLHCVMHSGTRLARKGSALTMLTDVTIKSYHLFTSYFVPGTETHDFCLLCLQFSPKPMT